MPANDAALIAVSDCSVCGTTLERGLRFERYPLITSASAGGGNAPLLPIEVGLCPCCAHVQLTQRPGPDLLDRIYSSDYTSVVAKGVLPSADRMAVECKTFFDFAFARPVKGLRVMEIGCFDGSFLAQFEGCELLGCEPNAMGEVAAKRGIKVIRDYFRGSQFEAGSLDIIIMRHLIEHLPEPAAVLDECRALLSPNGVLLIETPHIEHTLENRVLGNFYHQHLHYFSRASLESLLARRGFAVAARARKDDFRQFVLARVSADVRVPPSSEGKVAALRAEMVGYGETVGKLRRDLCRFADTHAGRIAIYGASSTATGIIHLGGFPQDRIAYLLDADPRKAGYVAPGTDIKVFPPGHLREDPVDTVIIASDFYGAEIAAILKSQFADVVKNRLICYPALHMEGV